MIFESWQLAHPQQSPDGPAETERARRTEGTLRYVTSPSPLGMPVALSR